ncbi:CBS domain protein [Oesophagostomum dentatum]|uniref:CBS domain protein n=1 Tax=Oesophagostomum dentatum TaxID=61180 RepID=A0A0B1TQT5_OESDE|nr:CBS domain protein [Oesophagostomum dentatum]
MLETTKPLNVYCTSESGYDSPHASADSSRRNSIGFKEYVKSRRFTMMSKPNRVTVPIPSTCDASRKTSSSDSNFYDMPDDIDDDLSPRPLYQRRMSVPEKVFHSADYAILRPSAEADIKFEIVAAFDRYTDPYRHYMQSLTCYDLQPIHGAVVVIDGDLKIHKALTALSQCGHQVAIVSNLDVKGGLGIITVTDCLKAIVLASEGVQKVAEQTVAQFLKSNNRKQLVTADVNASVWDAAKLICLNRIHRIPVVHFDDGTNPVDSRKQQGTLLYVLSLRTVFMETIVKLVSVAYVRLSCNAPKCKISAFRPDFFDVYTIFVHRTFRDETGLRSLKIDVIRKDHSTETLLDKIQDEAIVSIVPII